MKRGLIIKTRMKNGLNKKTFWMVIFLLFYFDLVGYIFYKPVLKNADKPFIELSGSVGEAIGNAKSAYDVEHPSISETQPIIPKTTEVPEKKEKKVHSNSIEIIVTDEKISINENSYDTYYDYKKIFKSETFNNKTIYLIDDYAEAKTFLKLLKLFEQSGLSVVIKRR